MAKRSLDSDLPSTSTLPSTSHDDKRAVKKAKIENDADCSFGINSSLIDELGNLEEEELRKEPHHTDTPSVNLIPNHSQDMKETYCRPPPPPIDPSEDVISFQQIDIDHYVGNSVPGMPGHSSGPFPILRMYGLTMDGNSVCAHLHSFRPYFYVPLPCQAFTSEHCCAFKNSLNNAVLSDMRYNRDNIVSAIEAVEICDRCSMYGFYGNTLYPFLKITVSFPKLVPAARRLVTSVQLQPFQTVCHQSYESNIEYEIRFMVDSGIVGCNWIDCPPGESILVMYAVSVME